jgi:hypothetical protein
MRLRNTYRLFCEDYKLEIRPLHTVRNVTDMERAVSGPTVCLSIRLTFLGFPLEIGLICSPVPHVSRSIYLSIYGSAAILLDLDRFFSFYSYTQMVGLLGRGISPLQGRYLHTEQHKHRVNAHRYPCLECDSNPRPQLSRDRRQFMP